MGPTLQDQIYSQAVFCGSYSDGEVARTLMTPRERSGEAGDLCCIDVFVAASGGIMESGGSFTFSEPSSNNAGLFVSLILDSGVGFSTSKSSAP